MEKLFSLGKMVTLRKNESLLEKWVTLGTIANSWKMGSTCQNGSHIEKCGTLGRKCYISKIGHSMKNGPVTLGKMGHTWKNESLGKMVHTWRMGLTWNYGSYLERLTKLTKMGQS